VAAACGLLIVWLSTLGPTGMAGASSDGKRAQATPAAVKFGDVEEIVITRCSMCHAAEPVWAGIVRAPHGVMLDTPDRIKGHARQIALAAVWSSAMPPSNVSMMTPEERQTLKAWLSGPR
jgi:uncharacterized membrane protein